jgi:glycosyltransferase involved in cell wall biosynthesis
MKILFVLEYYFPNIGGVEKLFKSLTERLVENGHEVTVVTSRFNKELPKNETINGVHVNRLNLSNRFLFTFFGFFSIFKIAVNFDLIHTTSYNAAVPSWLIAKLLRKKNIITFHEYWGKLWFNLPYLNTFQKIMFFSYEYFITKLKFDNYIAVSEYTKSRLIEAGIKPEKITQIYNGIDSKDYQLKAPVKSEIFTFTYFGRLGVSKGIDLILPAAKAITSKYPDSCFKLIIPKTPPGFYKKIMKTLREMDFGDQLKLFHHLDFESLKEEVASSHVVLIPSYSEGFCFAAVESTSLQVPIISSNRGALKETVSGRCIKMKELTFSALESALFRAKNKDFDAVKLRNFSLEKSLREYLLFYDSLWLQK